jgi:hypothetical protein
MPLSVPHLRRKYNMPEPGPNEESTGKHNEPAAAPSVPPLPDPTLPDKLAALCAITDDAIFAKELQQLTDSLK